MHLNSCVSMDELCLCWLDVIGGVSEAISSVKDVYHCKQADSRVRYEGFETGGNHRCKHTHDTT